MWPVPWLYRLTPPSKREVCSLWKGKRQDRTISTEATRLITNKLRWRGRSSVRKLDLRYLQRYKLTDVVLPKLAAPLLRIKQPPNYAVWLPRRRWPPSYAVSLLKRQQSPNFRSSVISLSSFPWSSTHSNILFLFCFWDTSSFIISFFFLLFSLSSSYFSDTPFVILTFLHPLIYLFLILFPPSSHFRLNFSHSPTPYTHNFYCISLFPVIIHPVFLFSSVSFRFFSGLFFCFYLFLVSSFHPSNIPHSSPFCLLPFIIHCLSQ